MTTTETTPQLGAITHHRGIAGQESYAVTVTYPGEDPSRVEFVGSRTYGGPVVMVTSSGQVFVSDPSRFGPFGTGWVRRFFGEEV